MSNYVKSTNFTAKDSLPTGDANKVIRGSEFDTEFNAIQVASATKADLGSPTFTGTATFANVTVSGTVTAGTIDLNGGALDNVTIGGTTPAAGTFTSLVATTADINGGTVDGAVIGGTTPAAGTFTSLVATTADINGGTVDNVAIGATTASTGAFTSLVSATADINGGTIDGTVIGGSTPAAGTFAAVAGTTGTFSGAVTGPNLNIANWNTAYGWGDHASAGYLTSVAFSNIDANAVVLSSETFVSNDTTLPTTATMTARILAAAISPAASLDDLSDVNLTPAPTDGQTLVYDNSTSKFIAGTSGAGLDGGFANSTYLTAQNFNGGGA